MALAEALVWRETPAMLAPIPTEPCASLGEPQVGNPRGRSRKADIAFGNTFLSVIFRLRSLRSQAIFASLPHPLPQSSNGGRLTNGYSIRKRTHGAGEALSSRKE